MSLVNKEFVADLLLQVMAEEPELPLFFGCFTTEIKTPAANGQMHTVQTREVDDPSYSRQPVKFTKAGRGVLGLRETIKFPPTVKRWERVTHLAVFDAKAGGHLLLLKPTGGVTTVEAGSSVCIRSDEFLLCVGENLTTQ